MLSKIVSNSTCETSNVGIIASHGTFEKWRVDNVSSKEAGRSSRARKVGNVNLHDVASTFAVADNVLGKTLAYLMKGLFRLFRVYRL